MANERFWNYWIHRFTIGLSEGVNRAIKGLKWEAYGYKNMSYFALKIMQKCLNLNHRWALAGIPTQIRGPTKRKRAFFAQIVTDREYFTSLRSAPVVSIANNTGTRIE